MKFQDAQSCTFVPLSKTSNYFKFYGYGAMTQDVTGQKSRNSRKLRGYSEFLHIYTRPLVFAFCRDAQCMWSATALLYGYRDIYIDEKPPKPLISQAMRFTTWYFSSAFIGV